MRLKMFCLSSSLVYFSGLLIAVGLLLHFHPWLFEYVAYGTTTNKVPPRMPLVSILLSVGFFSLSIHCAANEYPPGKVAFGFLGLLCLLQALACMF